MGASTSKSAVIANLSSPMYCLNMVGSRHILMAGGGGGSKTGVKNELQTWLFGYDTDISSAPSIQRDDAGARIREAVTVDTSPYATMDLDVTPLGVPGDGRYLIATSHDHFCDVYETDGFEVVERDDAPPTVGFTPRLVAHFESVTAANKKNDKYQKGVKFANIEGSLLIVTAGSDGRIKTWSVDDILRNAANVIPLREWTVCDSEIDQIEVTADGTTLFTIGQRSLLVWDVATGRQLKEINSPEGYAPRCVRFTKKDKRNNIFFVVGYNPNVPRGKKSMIVHFVLSLTQSDQFAVVGKADVFSEKISKMGVQRGGKWMAVGTMEGSVAIYKLDDLVAAKKIIGTHRDSFITGIEVLPERTDDFPDLKDENGKSLEFYGPHAEAAVSVVTTSNDLTVQLHSVPYYDSKPSIVFALILSILLMIIFPALVALIANL